MENKLDLLQKIEKVNAPPFLYTKILADINNRTVKQVSPFAQWSLAISFTLLLLLNIGVLLKNNLQSKKSSGIENLVNDLGLKTNNNFYNE